MFGGSITSPTERVAERVWQAMSKPVAAATAMPTTTDLASEGPKERLRPRDFTLNASKLPSSHPRRAPPSRGDRSRPPPQATQAKPAWLGPPPPATSPPVKGPTEKHADELTEYMENLRTTVDNGESGVLSVRKLSAVRKPKSRPAGCFASTATQPPPPPPQPPPPPPPAFPPSSDGGGGGSSGGGGGNGGGGGGSGGLDRQALMREYQCGRAAPAAPRLTLPGAIESCVCEVPAPVRAAQLDEVRLATPGWQRGLWLCTPTCSLCT